MVGWYTQISYQLTSHQRFHRIAIIQMVMEYWYTWYRRVIEANPRNSTLHPDCHSVLIPQVEQWKSRGMPHWSWMQLYILTSLGQT